TSLTMSGGRLSGSDNVTLAGPASSTWTGGTMSGSGQTTTNGSLAITANNATELNGRTLNINGGATLTAGAAPFWLDDNGAVVNNAGLFDVQSDVTFFHNAGALSTFNNLATGTFRKSAGTGATDVQFAFNNSGA